MHETGKIVFFHIPPILGIDFSITPDVALVLIAGLLTFLLLFFACRRTELVARGTYRNLFETIIEFIDEEVVRQMLGAHASGWAPFAFTLFFFILFCNLLGLVPLPGSESHPLFKPVTSNWNVPAALAIMALLVSQGADIYRHGLRGYFKKVVPGGVPWWIAPFVFFIEMVCRLVRPLSLTLRLFANMTAGHAIILAFIGLGMACQLMFIKPLPLVGTVLMSAFELFVCFIQAFVFTILTCSYIGEAFEETH